MPRPLNAFRIADQKGLRLAVCDSVPPVMVIAGPNGVGKSTLLSAIHRRNGTLDLAATARILYQPPHRAIRRQQVRRRFLMGQLRSFLDAFSATDVAAPEGISIPFPSRTPDNVDETGSTVKFTLGQLENRRQSLITQRFDQLAVTGTPMETVGQPDIYGPLAELVARLLPHLRFRGIDFRNEDDIRCSFDRTDTVGTVTIDLDDLSSGEKSIILLFLPLIEDSIQARMRQFAGEQIAAAAETPRVFLIDEPEQHLHPDLQARLLAYLRDETAKHNIQFVLATHSPTLVDQAFDTELYLLELAAAAGHNQLRRVTSSAERLEGIRSLAGATYPITTGKTIVCLEGQKGEAAGSSDVSLLAILWPQSTRYTFIPLGSRGHVERVVPRLRESLIEENYAVDVFGLVDRDRGESKVDGVLSWGVVSIENLLLLATQPIATGMGRILNRHIDNWEVDAALKKAGTSRREDEIRLRVIEEFGPQILRVGSQADVDSFKQHLDAKTAGLEQMVKDATMSVDAALSDGSFVAKFRGKELLKDLYKAFELDQAQISRDEFIYAVAKECAEAKSALREIETVFAMMTAPAVALPATKAVALTSPDESIIG